MKAAKEPRQLTSDIADLLGVTAPDDLPIPSALAADALGELLGMSGRQVREWASRGILVRAQSGGFSSRASIRAYCVAIREQASGRAGSTSLTAERTRLAREQADAAEIKNAIARGEMVASVEVEHAWMGVLRDVRSSMLAIPARISGSTTLTQLELANLDREIRKALEDMGNGR